MIEIRELTKMYGKQYALNHLSLTIPEGQIFGFLGHNGAGKSTTIKCLTSIIEPTSGQVLVDGLNLAEHHSEIKKRIGYVPDTPDIFLQLSPKEYWNLIASAFALETSEKERNVCV